MSPHLDLNGTWLMQWSDGQRGRLEHAAQPVTDESRFISARVPGEVHLDLMQAGLIQEPSLGNNHLACRWVEESYWSYRRTFTPPADALAARAWLVFEGLDYAAQILLNGEEIASHHNVFHPCRVEVTGKLQPGENLLTVHLESGLWSVADKPATGYLQSEDQRLHKRHWLRKPQFQFSWDWAPRLINVGIFKPVRLEWTSDPLRLDQFVPLVTLSPDLRQGKVTARWFVEGLTAQATSATLTVSIPEANIIHHQPVTIQPGIQAVETTVTVADPELWYPVGHGSQKLYAISASLAVAGAEVGNRQARIGFRRVVINQESHPEGGNYFVIEINNQPVFVKGGNFVPADIILARIDRARYEKLVELALEANFNMLRVWGGGLYEADEFYDLCDERGILVWQEFIFACAKYPGTDETFLNDVKVEARYNLRRLAAHPSLIVWCGNNEIEVANWSWAGYDRQPVHPDHALYHLVLPRLMAEEDPTRYYQPSSPFSPDHQHPARHDMGDQHPWELGFGDDDFRRYRSFISRFPNEGGFMGPPALPTLQAALQGAAINSFTWRQHDNAIALLSSPSAYQRMLRRWLGVDMNRLSPEEYVYWAGLFQGEALREFIDNYRRRMFSSSAAIFWMYNDCWPVTRSWTIVDYYLRRTPAYAPVKRSFAPIHVVLVEDESEVSVFGINDTQQPVSADLAYGLFTMDGGYHMNKQARSTLPPNASTRLASFPKSVWTNPNHQIAYAMLTRNGELLARNRLILPMFSELDWAKPELSIRQEDGKAIFTSDVFVWGVCLDLTGEQSLPDNFFDVYPGVPYSLPWTQAEEPTILGTGNLWSSP